MSFLKLNWCQLIKIILSQIGGNPLQQIYSQLNQGLPTMAPGGVLPAGLAEMKNLIETVTATINAAQQAAANFTDTVDQLAAQFYENPVGTVTQGTISATDTRLAFIQGRLDAETATPGTLTPEELASYTSEKAFLTSLRADLVTFKSNTDKLSGVGTQTSGSQPGCSIQDLLGSGCTPNQDVPDIDIQQLIESLKRGDAIAAVQEKIKNASGVSDLEQALASFKSETQAFNTSYASRLNRAAVRNAVTGQLTQIVYNLLTGCGNTVFDLTLKKNVKDAVGPYVTLLEQQRDNQVYLNAEGNVSLPPDNSTYTPPINNIVLDTNLGSTSSKVVKGRYYVNGVEVTKEVFDQYNQ